jgi:PAS domain S-box-containing protein
MIMEKKGNEHNIHSIFNKSGGTLQMDAEAIGLFFENIIMNAKLLMAFLDLKGNVLIWNLAAEEVTGYSGKEVLERNEIWKWIYPDAQYRKEVTQKIVDIVGNKKYLDNFESNIHTKSGETRVISWNTRLLLGENQKTVGYIVLGNDITKYRKAEAALKKSEEKFRIVADFTYDWEYWLAPDNTFIYVTPSCERITGYTAGEFYKKNGRFLDEITYPEDKPVLAGHLDNIFVSKKPETVDYRIVRRDGEVRWIAHICQPVYGSKGELLGRRGTNRDITDRKKAEAAVKESNERYLAYIKEAAMRLRTPVEVVQQNISILLEDIEGGEFERGQVVPQLRLQVKNLEQIRQNIQDLNKTIVDGFGEIPPASKKFLTE